MRSAPTDLIPADLPDEVLAALRVLEQEGREALCLSRVATRLGRRGARGDLPWTDECAMRSDLAALGFHMLHRTLDGARTASGAMPAEARLFACGRAYVTTALRSPALFALMREANALDFTAPTLERESDLALEELKRLVAELRADGFEPGLDAETLSLVVWDSVHRLTLRWADAAVDGAIDTQALDEGIELELTLLLAGAAAPAEQCELDTTGEPPEDDEQ